MLWRLKLLLGPRERVQVLRDNADLQVFLHPHLDRLRWKIRIGSPRLDRRLYGEGLQEGPGRRRHRMSNPSVGETNLVFFAGIPLKVVNVRQVVGRPGGQKFILLEKVS